jgi:branched-chain amino acid transport system ATP-binding protein
MQENREPILSVNSVTMQFGGLKAVDNLSLKIFKGELIGLIGPNGAGKTTAFNVITGVYKPTIGDVQFLGNSIVKNKPFQICSLGMTRTFQNIRLFKTLSVIENVMVADHQHYQSGVIATLLQTKSHRHEEQEQKDRAMNLLKIMKLDHKADHVASSLPYGEQRKLEIARALATKPKLILLDEPAAGMNHQETHALMHLIQELRNQFKLSILLIEHDMKLVMGICERIIVLDHGVKIEEGVPSVIQNSKKVIEAYLGSEADA